MAETRMMTGGEAAVAGALAAEAKIMYGYPITPSTEILQGFIAAASKDKSLKFLQTEDETSAGFAVCGALLSGEKAFTATAGPGTVLMQDPMSMAENMRLPFVCLVMQRGGPSTGTVNFSQQEVNLSAFGGNGDGLRIVYSASSPEEIYRLTVKAFSVAWKYRFPTIILGDGHLAKMRLKTKISPPLKPFPSASILKEATKPTYLRNCFSSEDQFGERLKENVSDWISVKEKISEAEEYMISGADEIIIAHGSVAEVAKEAVDIFRQTKRKIGLFRPITLNPLSATRLRKIMSRAKRVYIVESSLNQLSRIIKYECYGLQVPICEITKPAVSFSSSEIVKKIKSIL